MQKIAEYEASVKANRLTPVLRWLGRTRIFAFFYRYVGPRLDCWIMLKPALARLYGLPCLLLTTTGAKSGQPRTVPLLYVREGDSFVVLGTNFGQLHHPAWTANLLVRAQGAIEIAGHRVEVSARLVEMARWNEIFSRFVSIYPGYQDYLDRCGSRQPRMFELVSRD